MLDADLRVLLLVMMTWVSSLALADRPPVRVLTFEVEPFVIKSRKNPESSDKFEYTGFIPEMAHELFQFLNMSYTITYKGMDMKYGTLDKDNKTWTGGVGAVIRNEYDLFLADAVISSDRLDVIDYTPPFFITGIGIIYRKSKREQRIFSFLDPLKTEIWLLALASYAVVSIFTFILGRCFDHVDGSKKENMKTTCVESFWSSWASFVGQGTYEESKVMSMKVLQMFWWIFTLLLVSCYTANLAAFLTRSRMEDSPLNTVEDLLNQKKITYGPLKSSSVIQKLGNSNRDSIIRLSTKLQKERDNLPSTFDEAVARMQTGTFAFIYDLDKLNYIKAKQCDIVQIGDHLTTILYAGIMKKDSPLYEDISVGIIQLQADGILAALQEKYWANHAHCEPETNQSGIGVESLGGIFIILAVGAGFSVLVGCVETLMEWSKTSPTKVGNPRKNAEKANGQASMFAEKNKLKMYPD